MSPIESFADQSVVLSRTSPLSLYVLLIMKRLKVVLLVLFNETDFFCSRSDSLSN
jgi:hypothetical protein